MEQPSTSYPSAPLVWKEFSGPGPRNSMSSKPKDLEQPMALRSISKDGCRVHLPGQPLIATFIPTQKPGNGT